MDLATAPARDPAEAWPSPQLHKRATCADAPLVPVAVVMAALEAQAAPEALHLEQEVSHTAQSQRPSRWVQAAAQVRGTVGAVAGQGTAVAAPSEFPQGPFLPSLET